MFALKKMRHKVLAARPLHEENGFEGRVLSDCTLPGMTPEERRGYDIWKMARQLGAITFCAAADVGLKRIRFARETTSKRQIKRLETISNEEIGYSTD